MEPSKPSQEHLMGAQKQKLKAQQENSVEKPSGNQFVF